MEVEDGAPWTAVEQSTTGLSVVAQMVRVESVLVGDVLGFGQQWIGDGKRLLIGYGIDGPMESMDRSTRGI